MTDPVDLTPAEPEPPSLLEQMRLTVSLAEPHKAINNHRTETTKEES